MNKNQVKNLYIPISLILIFFFSFLIRLQTADEPFLLSYDSFYFYRHAEMLVSGEKPQYDVLVTQPTPPEFKPAFLSYLAAYSYKFAHLFFPQLTFLIFAFLFSAFLAALSVFPVYFIGRQVLNPLAGLFAAFFFNFSPFFISRNMAGAFDTDSLNLFFIAAIIAFFIYGFRELKEKKETKKAIIYFFLAGLFTWLFTWNWDGYWIVIWLTFIPLILFWGMGLCLKRKFRKSEKQNKPPIFAGKSRTVFPLILVSIFFITIIFLKYNFLIAILSGPLHFFTVSSANEGELFPSTTITVTEYRKPADFSEILTQIGPSSFLLAILGFLILSYSFFRKNFFSREKIFNYDWRNLNFFLILIWTVGTFIANMTAVKYYQYFAMPVSLLAGFALAKIWRTPFNKNFIKDKTTRSFIIAFLLIFSLFSGYLSISFSLKQSSQVKTSVTENYGQAFYFLRDNTPKDSIVIAWWPQGYWVQELAERRTIIDGGTQLGTFQIPLDKIGEEKCQERKGYMPKDLKEFNLKTEACITSRIQDISNVLFIQDPDKAREILKSYCDANFEKKDCEIYLLLGEELIYKANFWTYFATWNRGKKQGDTYAYQTKRKEQNAIEVSAPVELVESLFTKLYLLEKKVPNFELFYKNPQIKIYKVL